MTGLECKCQLVAAHSWPARCISISIQYRKVWFNQLLCLLRHSTSQHEDLLQRVPIQWIPFHNLRKQRAIHICHWGSRFEWGILFKTVWQDKAIQVPHNQCWQMCLNRLQSISYIGTVYHRKEQLASMIG